MSSEPDIRFADLGLAPVLLEALEELGYEAPTPIQAGAIPPLLEGRDMIGQAQTGTGKTAAFALPLLQRLDLTRRDVQAIVLTPTRELAMQVASAVRGTRPNSESGKSRTLAWATLVTTCSHCTPIANSSTGGSSTRHSSL